MAVPGQLGAGRAARRAPGRVDFGGHRGGQGRAGQVGNAGRGPAGHLAQELVAQQVAGPEPVGAEQRVELAGRRRQRVGQAALVGQPP